MEGSAENEEDVRLEAYQWRSDFMGHISQKFAFGFVRLLFSFSFQI